MNNHIINLGNFLTPKSKVFTGRDRGQEVRVNSHIENLVEQYDTITISIPAEVRSINPSFLEEFLLTVVDKLGKKGFYEKFLIDNPGRYKIDEDLTKAIDRLIREENALH